MIVLLEHVEDHLYIVCFSELSDGTHCDLRRLILRESEYTR